MIRIDINVLSAMMRVANEPAVERWFDAQPPESIWTTAITIFEIRFGLALLAPSRRRDRLAAAFDRAIDDILGGRVLPFDRYAAQTAAVIAAGQRQIGRPIEIRDVQIAGITAARKATLATRNIRHFQDLVSLWSIPGGRRRPILGRDCEISVTASLLAAIRSLIVVPAKEGVISDPDDKNLLKLNHPGPAAIGRH